LYLQDIILSVLPRFTDPQTTQWPKEEEQTTQWPKEEEQTSQRFEDTKR
jgi:hypothetical protein